VAMIAFAKTLFPEPNSKVWKISIVLKSIEIVLPA